jgi:hypothetical protein
VTELSVDALVDGRLPPEGDVSTTGLTAVGVGAPDTPLRRLAVGTNETGIEPGVALGAYC